MASALEDVQAALIATFTAALGSAVPVYDGYALTNQPDDRLVLVGDDGDPESDTASSFEQEWADLGATSRYERGSIPCAVIASSGDTEPADWRAAAFAVLATCETALRANRQLGGVVMTSQVELGSALLLQNEDGLAVIAQFTVTYMAQV